jgi:Fe-S-cluster containining protein
MHKITEELETLKQRSRNWQKSHRKDLIRIGKMKDLTEMCQVEHQQIFSKISCLDCANCCKTTGPLFTSRDISRISKHLKLSYQLFSEKYLKRDEDDDMVLQTLPCPFLAENNECRIYDHRPKACREYPHTDTFNQNKIFKLTLKNAEICPAVFEILQTIKANVEAR